MTPDQLRKATGCTSATADTWATSLTSAMSAYSITTQARQAAFLAQVGHESESFTVLVENLDYSAEALLATFPSHFDAASAADYARNPERIANHVYANRNGNGDEASGDGWKFRGRGFLQITGRANYDQIGQILCLDCTNHPDMLATTPWAAWTSAWWWARHGLNELADRQLFSSITQRINGGQLGAADRLARYHTALEALA